MRILVTSLLFYFVFSGSSLAIPEPLSNTTQQNEWSDAELTLKIRNIWERNPGIPPEQISRTINLTSYLTLNPIYNLMIKLGFMGEEGWMIDRKKGIKILHEILYVIRKNPNATYEQVITEINNLRKVQYLPPVEEEWVYRLMKEAGLLEQKRFFRIETEEISFEIKEVLKQFPNAGYLKVTAEINRARLAKGYLDIIFWPWVYMIMEHADLLINTDNFVFEEIQQEVQKQEHYNQLTFAEIITEEVNNDRADNKQKLVELDQVYRLMSEAGLLKKRETIHITRKDKKILAEIKEVLADYQDTPETITFETATIEINYRRLIKALHSGENVEPLSRNKVYRIIHEAGLLEEDAQSIKNHDQSDELFLEEVIRALKDNPGYSYEMLISHINSTRAEDEQISEEHIHALMNTQETQPIDRMKYYAMFELVIENLDQDPEMSYSKGISELNLAHFSINTRNPVSYKRVEELMAKMGLLIQEPFDERMSDKRKWLLQRIREIKAQEQYKDYSIGKVTEIINSTLDESQRFTEFQVRRLMRQYKILERQKRLNNERKMWLLQRIKELKNQEKYKNYGSKRLAKIINSTLDQSQRVSEFYIRKLMRQHNIPGGENGKVINRKEDDLLLREIRQLLQENAHYTTREIVKALNERRLITSRVGMSRIIRIIREAKLLKKPRGVIDRSEDVEVLAEITQLLNENPHHTVRTITKALNERRLTKKRTRIGRTRITRIMREAKLLKKPRGIIDRLEDEEILAEITQLLNENPYHTVRTITKEFNARRLSQNKPRVGRYHITRIMREANLIKKPGPVIDKSEDAEILAGITQLLNPNPHYTTSKLTREFNKIRSAQEKPTVGEEKITRIMLEAGLLTPEQYHARWKNKGKKPIAAGVGGVGLIASAGVEESYAQAYITSEAMEGATPLTKEDTLMEVNEFTSGITPHTEGITLETMVDMISRIMEIGRYSLEMGGEAAPFGVGAAVAISAIATGIHPMTQRPISLDERINIAKWIPLNFIGWKFLQPFFKSFTHINFSKLMRDFTINGEQLNKVVSLIGEGKVDKAKELFASLFRPKKGIKQKVKPTRSRNKGVTGGGDPPSDEVAETIFINVDEFNQIKPGQLHKAIDITDPSASKVFIQTPDGNTVPLDFNNPEVLRWLRDMEAPQIQALKSLIKNKPAVTDFDMVLQ